MERQIYITELDKNRILEQIGYQKEFGSGNRGGLEELEKELGRAIVVDSHKIPPDVITMNSVIQIRFDDDLDDLEEITLVYPNEAAAMENKISIMAPVGTALLGHREGNEVEWEVPDGKVKIIVEKILYQPEAAGNFDR
ncbi:nucleoside diphosphate kinase regulator [Alkalibacter rhizosphaerae]|uniref:Nucleoside diphosphate kinase regulator n=1 Tax=Alkalibacter rhizosphaerae TaxID=2815577 RepID=A0A974XNH6_9FIRM|nr:nucleoside diphosphate kinase regulator [Alkalibacter rhizosphaerae]QSX09106.1 nucleoside diphosphate kinase regulator [Alkalibacter rhizosphaerae]